MIASASALPRDIEEDVTMFNRDTTDAETKPAEKMQRLDVDEKEQYFDCQNLTFAETCRLCSFKS